jgi:protein-S-isoprenylcysteine O-methyltransferase Ste14
MAPVLAAGPPIFVGNPGATLPGLVAFWVLFYGWVASEIFLGWRHRLQPGASVHDRGSRFLLIGSIYIGVSGGIALASEVPALAITAGRTAVFAGGLVLMAGGMALRFYAIRVLGTFFTYTVATRTDQTVVEVGPYRWVRHPSYSGSLLTVLGVMVCCANLASLMGLIIPLVGYAYRMRVEEQALMRDLGDPYRAYMRRTRRLIPFLV